MLVLRRLPGQHLVVAGNIRITILKVRGDQIKLGIEAPPEVAILRGELLERSQTILSAEEEQIPLCAES